MNGLLLVDKPKGWTSFDVVARVRGVLVRDIRAEHIARGYCLDPIQRLSGKSSCRCKLKVGHTGTLDPMATGLLVLCIGSYTKKVPEMIKHDKTYEAEITLGATSTTGDAEGEITLQLTMRNEQCAKDSQLANSNGSSKNKAEHEGILNELVQTSNIQSPTSETIKYVLDGFVGEHMQTPPAYSALKVNGQRAYDLARAGKPVTLEPRKITIHSIDLVDYNWPKLNIVCSVGSGTYIRSLAEDIGTKLGTGAYLSALRRTVVDTYHVEKSIKIDKVVDLKQVRDSVYTLLSP